LSAIPFNRASLMGDEIESMLRAIRDGHISGDGQFTKQCEAFLQAELPVARALLTTSGTHALEMAAFLLDTQPGDEVILPSFTFVSTANAFFIRGARPVFADIRADTLNLDESKLEALITPRTKAIVPVHYAGVGCEMDIILDIAKQRSISVVEDNAHGLFSRYKGKHLGTLGRLAALSFHETKNFTCGEGGALLVNDERLIRRAEIIREKGTDRAQFFRGEVDKYTWIGQGSSYVPADMLAAFLHAQFKQKAAIQSARRRVWETYYKRLGTWAAQHEIGLPVVPSHCEQTYHMFYLLMPSRVSRDHLIETLKSQGIMAVFHYLPLHLSPVGLRHDYAKGDCPITEDVSDRIVRLPFYNGLSEGDLVRVCDVISERLHI
jgi:dTDP-4-amino-4,6-dideoxygalactose transaminase